MPKYLLNIVSITDPVRVNTPKLRLQVCTSIVVQAGARVEVDLLVLVDQERRVVAEGSLGPQRHAVGRLGVEWPCAAFVGPAVPLGVADTF